jgi:nucleolar protein 4
MEKRAKGELPEKEKKVLHKSAVMKKTRVGMKGKKGRPEPSSKSFEKVLPKLSEKRKFDEPASQSSKRIKGAKGQKEPKEFKPGFPPGEEGRLQRRAQIIQKKRMMRKKRHEGA